MPSGPGSLLKFNGHVGAQTLTQAAGAASLLRHDNSLFVTIKHQNLLRAKSYANAAAFTPLSVDDDVLLSFWGFSHRPLKQSRLR